MPALRPQTGPGPDDPDPRFHEGRLISLVYGDATQSIGVDETCSLEDAVTRATLYGSPSVFSLRFALIQLFQRIGQLLHYKADDDPRNASRDGPNLDFPRLWESLQLWAQRSIAPSRTPPSPRSDPRKLALDVPPARNTDRPEDGYRSPSTTWPDTSSLRFTSCRVFAPRNPGRRRRARPVRYRYRPEPHCEAARWLARHRNS